MEQKTLEYEPYALLSGHRSSVTAISFCPTNRDFICSACLGGIVPIWNIPKQNADFQVDVSRIPILSVEFHPNGKLIAVCDGSVRVWDGGDAQLVFSFVSDKVEERITLAKFDPLGTLLIGVAPKYIFVWDIIEDADGMLRTQFNLRGAIKTDGNSILSVSFSPDGKYLVAGCLAGNLLVFEIQTGFIIACMDVREGAVEFLITALDFSPDGSLIGSGGKDGALRIWDAERWRKVFSVAAHSAQINCLRFHPEANLIFTCSMDHTFCVWNARGRTDCLVRVNDGNSAIQCLDISPRDPNLFAIAGNDKNIRVYRITKFPEENIRKRGRTQEIPDFKVRLRNSPRANNFDACDVGSGSGFEESNGSGKGDQEMT